MLMRSPFELLVVCRTLSYSYSDPKKLTKWISKTRKLNSNSLLLSNKTHGLRWVLYQRKLCKHLVCSSQELYMLGENSDLRMLILDIRKTILNILDFRHCLNVGSSLSPLKNSSSVWVKRVPPVILPDWCTETPKDPSEVIVWFRLPETISSLLTSEIC